MHFDPDASEHSPVTPNPKLVNAIIGEGLDEDVDAPPREGLPPAFRMRHARHYVEQVMGDAPIRTVREIALQDIDDAPDVEAADVQALESSIRDVGVLEPLLVWPLGRRFRVIGGTRRLQAARAAGLRTVPCLVQDVDEEMAARIREALRVKPTPVEPPPPAPAPEPAPVDCTAPAGAVGFVSALAPALEAAGADPLRRSVLADLAASELARERCAAACAGIDGESTRVEAAAVDIRDVLQIAVAAVVPEARLRAVRLEVSGPSAEYRMAMDARLVSTAACALLHGALALVREPGATLRIAMQATTLRPAMILDVSLERVEVDPATTQRLFDDALKPHPCGPSGALLMSSVRRVARLHGGRADAHAIAPDGFRLTFVVPRPLADV